MPRSFNDKLTRWEALNANLKPQLTDLPNLQKGQEDLERLLQKGLEVVAQQNQYTGLARQAVAEREELEKEGDQLVEFLAAGLRHALGPKSVKLHEFGLRPRNRGRKPKKQEPTNGGTTEPPVVKSAEPPADEP